MTVGFHGWLTALMTLTPFLCASYPDFVITVLIDPDIFQFHTGYVELYGNMVDCYENLLHSVICNLLFLFHYSTTGIAKEPLLFDPLPILPVT